MVPTDRRHMRHIECHNQLIGNQVWRMGYLTEWSSRLAASVLRFDAVRLSPVELRLVYGPCQQVRDD